MMQNEELVVLVDQNDSYLGVMEKHEAHQKGLLHRAFSVFIFNSNNELLLQQRASTKYHSPLLWTNTCCSHPRLGESVLEASNRRLLEEMGMSCELQIVDSIIYKAQLDQGMIEHEFDYILIGKTDDLPKINPLEVEHYAYFSLESIKRSVTENPSNYTEWFKIIFPKLSFYPI
jgi:isopentenyl-diphosphate delta-isomerase